MRLHQKCITVIKNVPPLPRFTSFAPPRQSPNRLSQSLRVPPRGSHFGRLRVDWFGAFHSDHCRGILLPLSVWSVSDIVGDVHFHFLSCSEIGDITFQNHAYCTHCRYYRRRDGCPADSVETEFDWSLFSFNTGNNNS